MSVFYDHLLEISEIDRDLQEMALEHHEKAHLLEIVDSALHHAVMETILSELPSHTHQDFLRDFAISPHDSSHMQFLLVHSPEIETKIRTKAKETKEKFKEEIRKRKAVKKN